MELTHFTPLQPPAALLTPPAATPSFDDAAPSDELRARFHDFVGQTLFGQMLASMRKSLDKPAYLHGGRAEEVFQTQLDQQLVERISEASAATLAEPMFQLFMQGRMS